MITLDTVFNCTVPISVAPTDGSIRVGCGSDVPYGCTLMYSYAARDGCVYAIYDANDNCIGSYSYRSDTTSNRACGGGFTVDDTMSYMVFSDNTLLHIILQRTVAELIDGVGDLAELLQRLTMYGIDEQYTQDIINIYLDSKDGAQSPGCDCVDPYPVGAIYLASIDIHPSKFFGGTWQELLDVFPTSVYAWTRLEDSVIAIADIAIVDISICA